MVFPSTNLVFDGCEAFRRSDEPVSPRAEYGRQKAAAERGLLGLAPEQAAIVRLTKVLDPEDPLLNGWIAALRRGEPVHPFRDKVMAPVSLSSTVKVLLGVAQARLRGISQYSAARDISYVDAALALCRELGIPTPLIEPLDSASAGLRRSSYLDTPRSAWINLPRS